MEEDFFFKNTRQKLDLRKIFKKNKEKLLAGN